MIYNILVVSNIIDNYDPLKYKKTAARILILIVIFAAIFLRLYKINQVPPGLSQDETAIGYNAYSINEIGKDEYGKSYPLYFKSFGDYKLPVYIYLTSISIKLFGLNEFAVRFPSALAGIIAVILLFFLTRKITSNTTLALISSLSLAVNPWNLHFSRAAFEVNLALTLAISAIIFFISGIERKKIIYLLISSFFLALCLYTYNVTRLISPVFFIMLLFIYRKNLLKISKDKLLFVLLLYGLLLIPFIKTFFSPEGVFSSKESLITSTDILSKNIEMRSFLISLPNIYTKLLFNKYIFLIWQYGQNLVSTISGAFFFITGSTNGNQTIGNIGYFHLYEAPLIMAGIFLFIKYKIKEIKLFFYWLLIVFFTLALSKEVPHATRGYFLVIPLIIFASMGWLYLIKYILEQKKIIKYFLIIFSFFVFFYSLQYYLLSYYYRFPVMYERPYRRADKSLANYLKSVENKFDSIVIDKNADFIYTSILFYYPYPPSKFLDTVVRNQKIPGTLLLPEQFGKYVYRDINWENDIKKENTLLITNLNASTSRMKIPVKKFYSQERPLVVSENETIYQSPIKEVVYVIIDLNKINKGESIY